MKSNADKLSRILYLLENHSVVNQIWLNRFLKSNLDLEIDGKNIVYLFFELVAEHEIAYEDYQSSIKTFLKYKNKIDWHKVANNGKKPVYALMQMPWKMPVVFLEFYKRKDMQEYSSEKYASQNDLSFYRYHVNHHEYKDLLSFCLEEIQKGSFSKPSFLSGFFPLEKELLIYLEEIESSCQTLEEYVFSLTGRSTPEFKEFFINYHIKTEKISWYYSRTIRAICDTISNDKECLSFLKTYFRKDTTLGPFEFISEFEMRSLLDFIQFFSLERLIELIENSPDSKLLIEVLRFHEIVAQKDVRLSPRNYSSLMDYSLDLNLFSSQVFRR